MYLQVMTGCATCDMHTYMMQDKLEALFCAMLDSFVKALWEGTITPCENKQGQVSIGNCWYCDIYSNGAVYG